MCAGASLCVCVSVSVCVHLISTDKILCFINTLIIYLQYKQNRGWTWDTLNNPGTVWVLKKKKFLSLLSALELTTVGCFQRPASRAVSWMPPATPASLVPTASSSWTAGRTVVSPAPVAPPLSSRVLQILHSAWVSVCHLVLFVSSRKSDIWSWERWDEWMHEWKFIYCA